MGIGTTYFKEHSSSLLYIFGRPKGNGRIQIFKKGSMFLLDSPLHMIY